MSSAVHHPAHYGGEENLYEAIKVIEAWRLGFSLGNAVKYISRAGKKDPAREIEDLEKAVWYINRHIKNLREQGSETPEDYALRRGVRPGEAIVVQGCGVLTHAEVDRHLRENPR